ncbi:hypothetical protein IJI31_07035 [bacterium]|nr:hypothetical protein [bacterium]
MSLVNIISAVGNNSSVYPLIVRDCGIEGPAKIALTYQQNARESKEMARHATRERFIDEYGTSAVWLGGIPLVEVIYDKIVKKTGYNTAVNPKLFNEAEKQGLEYNIKKFADKAPDAVQDLIKVKNNKKAFERILSGKFLAATAIPTVLMGVVLPKLNFKLTDKKMKEMKEKQGKIDYSLLNLSAAENFAKPKENISFKGIASVLANTNQVQKMAVTDGGLTVGRVGTARNRNEKIEMGFKMGAMIVVNFVTPKYIQRGLDSFSKKLLGINVNVDPVVLNDKKFLKDIKEDTLLLPKQTESVIDFIDNNPEAKFTKYAQKFSGVKFIKGTNIRDPRAYVDEKKVRGLADSIADFASSAKASGNIEKYAKKALCVKSANIIANLGISSLLLAVGIPKAQFLLRKIISGTDIDPGLIKNPEEKQA